MNEKQLISQVMDLFAEIDRQQREIEGYKREFSNIDRRILEIGRKSTYKDSVCLWVKYNGDMDFEEWRAKKIFEIPDYMSRDEFYEYFDAELHADYESEKAKYELTNRQKPRPEGE